MTTLTIDITGFEDTLTAATDYENNYRLLTEPEYKPKTNEEFLQSLVIRQLEGLQSATERIKTDQEVRTEQARVAAAARNAGLTRTTVFR